MLATISLISLIATYSFKKFSNVVKSKLIKPLLIDETSRLNINDLIAHPIKTLRRNTRRRDDVLFKNVISNSPLKSEINGLSILIKEIKENKDAFQNALFYGPNGKLRFSPIQMINLNF